MRRHFAAYWLQTTVLIETTAGTGTGFFVEVGKEDVADPHIYLVTNKHVMSINPAIRAAGQQFILHANVVTEAGIIPQHVEVLYTQASYREHPDPEIDICAMEIRFVGQEMFLKHSVVNYALFASRERIVEHAISPGDDVLTIGYPLGYVQGVDNTPIIRQGIISTSLLDDLAGIALGRIGRLPAFLIDGGALPGSSGSPVILKPVVGRVIDSRVQLDPPPALLLGILAETRLARVPDTNLNAYAGFGMAYRVDPIRETLDLFP